MLLTSDLSMMDVLEIVHDFDGRFQHFIPGSVVELLRESLADFVPALFFIPGVAISALTNMSLVV